MLLLRSLAPSRSLLGCFPSSSAASFHSSSQPSRFPRSTASITGVRHQSGCCPVSRTSSSAFPVFQRSSSRSRSLTLSCALVVRSCFVAQASPQPSDFSYFFPSSLASGMHRAHRRFFEPDEILSAFNRNAESCAAGLGSLIPCVSLERTPMSNAPNSSTRLSRRSWLAVWLLTSFVPGIGR